jgi:hypothetical protein
MNDAAARPTNLVVDDVPKNVKLLRQAPAITEVAWIDAEGREQLRVSRLAMDSVSSTTR